MDYTCRLDIWNYFYDDDGFDDSWYIAFNTALNVVHNVGGACLSYLQRFVSPLPLPMQLSEELVLSIDFLAFVLLKFTTGHTVSTTYLYS